MEERRCRCGHRPGEPYDYGQLPYWRLGVLTMATGIVGGGVARLEGNHPILLENASFILENINARAYNEGVSAESDLFEGIDVEDAFFQASNFTVACKWAPRILIDDWLSVSSGR